MPAHAPLDHCLQTFNGLAKFSMHPHEDPAHRMKPALRGPLALLMHVVHNAGPVTNAQVQALATGDFFQLIDDLMLHIYISMDHDHEFLPGMSEEQLYVHMDDVQLGMRKEIPNFLAHNQEYREQLVRVFFNRLMVALGQPEVLWINDPV